MPQRHQPGHQELAVGGGQLLRAGHRQVPADIHVAQVGEDPVVEQDVRAVQPGDDDVLVVTRVAEDGRIAAVGVGGARHVFEHPAAADQQLRPGRPVRAGHVQVRAHPGAAAEHRVQVEGGGAGVGRDQRVLRDAQLGGLVEGDVVVDELAHERRPGRHHRVVRVGAIRVGGGRVPVDGRVGDQRHRPGGQVVPGVHDPPRHPDLQQGGLHLVGRLREGLQAREYPAEQARAGRGPRTARRGSARGASRRCRGAGTPGQQPGRRGCRRQPHTGRPQPRQELPPRMPARATTGRAIPRSGADGHRCLAVPSRLGARAVRRPLA